MILQKLLEKVFPSILWNNWQVWIAMNLHAKQLKNLKMFFKMPATIKKDKKATVVAAKDLENNKSSNLLKKPVTVNEEKEAARSTDSILKDISNNPSFSSSNQISGKQESEEFQKKLIAVPPSVQPLNSLPYPLHFKLAMKDDIQFSYSLLGQGGYGTVRKAVYCHETVAVKTIRRGFNEKYTQREIYVMTQLRHSNIIAIKSAALDYNQCYIIMEYFENVNLRNLLFDKVTKEKFALAADDRRYIAEQICKAVSYLHHSSINIIHEDLKPENTLVNTSLTVKICDMGLSRTSDLPSSLNTTVGDVYGSRVVADATISFQLFRCMGFRMHTEGIVNGRTNMAFVYKSRFASIHAKKRKT